MADLTGKQLAWADAYLETKNKTEASRRAGYKGNDVTLAAIGYENFKKPQISEYINRRLSERAMSANEVLDRLGEMARGDLGEFADVQLITDLKKHPKSYLMKKLTTDVFEDKAGKVHYKTHYELHDPQPALLNIGKQLGLFSDRHIIETKVAGEVDALLDILQQELPAEQYHNILARLGGQGTGAAKATEPPTEA